MKNAEIKTFIETLDLRFQPRKWDGESAVVKNIISGNSHSSFNFNKNRRGRVRAELIRALCADGSVRSKIHQRGLHVNGAVIVSDERLSFKSEYIKSISSNPKRHDLDIDLDSIQVDFSIFFNDCHIPGGFQARDSKIPFLCFIKCRLGELRLDRCQIDRLLGIGRTVFSFPLSIRNATIDGNFVLRSCRFIIKKECRKYSPISDENFLEKLGRPEPYGERTAYDLDLTQTKIARRLVLCNTRGLCTISLEDCSTSTFDDSANIYAKSSPNISNFKYFRILNNGSEDWQTQKDWRVRLWLKDAIQKSQVQPLDQLASALELVGEEIGRRKVRWEAEKLKNRLLINRLQLQAQHNKKLDENSIFLKCQLVLSKVLYGFYLNCFGLGFRIRYTVFSFLICWLLGAAVYHFAQEQDLFLPSSFQAKPIECKELKWTECDTGIFKDHVKFSRYIYSAKQLLPSPIARSKEDWIISRDASGYWYFGLFQNIFGWALSIAFVGQLTKKLIRTL